VIVPKSGRDCHSTSPWNLTSEITTYDRPHPFVDQQIAGPFGHRHPAHHFDTGRDGHTVMRNVVDFAAPFGLIGRLVDSILLTSSMTRLIRTRNDHLAAVERAGN
jgi:ligand-binding SRPBCC domain-containing protein